MEEDFGMQTNIDTIQIAILPSKTDESKPLHLEKGSDAASSINTLTAEPTVKYRNLESETSDVVDAAQVSNVRLHVLVFALVLIAEKMEEKDENSVAKDSVLSSVSATVDENVLANKLPASTAAPQAIKQLVVYNPRFGSTANGSVWSIPSSSASTAVHSTQWYKHPKVRENWKVVVASFVLFFIGLFGGIFMLFVIGVICFIPGVYHVIAVYYAVKGKRGFSFYNLPLFN